MWIESFNVPVSSVALAMAPNTATPTALPIERANRLSPVTTPRSSSPRCDCAAIRVGRGDQAHAQPDHEAGAATCSTDDDAQSEQQRGADDRDALPISAARKPIRR